jgi:uncharacterized membrane protein YjgN (DUF898 family)
MTALQATGPEPVPEATRREHGFEFRGTGGEYFRIWIVNLLLTLVTLGIYSAWAKVRTLRYFAASTRVDGASFAYVADPLAILKGRLLVFGFGVIYFVASSISPVLEGVAGLAMLLLIPWAIVKSLAFRAHNTVWREIRFRHHAPWSAGFGAFLGFPALGVLSAGLVYPYAVWKQRRLIVDFAAFGTTPFRLASAPRDFYRMFAGAIGIVALAGLLVAAALAAGASPWVAFLPAAPLYFLLAGYFSSRTANLTWEGAQLGAHRLSSRVPALGLSAIYLTNAVAIVVSLGLLVPWAKIRVVRFRLGHMSVHAAGDLEAFAAAEAKEVASLGAELGEALDLDLGL